MACPALGQASLADIDLSALLLVLLCFGHDDLQHAILNLGLDVAWVDLQAWPSMNGPVSLQASLSAHETLISVPCCSCFSTLGTVTRSTPCSTFA